MKTAVAAEPPERPRNEIRWPANTTTTAVTNGWIVLNTQPR